MIDWPDLELPPINLWTMPKQNVPVQESLEPEDSECED